MQISNKFTIAVHILTCIDYFGSEETVTSNFLAGSIGANPVIVRNVLGDLKEAGLVQSSQGKSGISLAMALEDVSLYDVYRATGGNGSEELFHFHEHTNPACPVGRNIQEALGGHLKAAQNAMEEQLRRTNLAEVADSVRRMAQTEEGTK